MDGWRVELKSHLGGRVFRLLRTQRRHARGLCESHISSADYMQKNARRVKVNAIL
jgi:hypothetical protein